MFIFMFILGFLIATFGVIVIINPEIIAILIGVFLVLVGVNVMILGYRIQKVKNAQSERIFSFGGYEFIKRNK